MKPKHILKLSDLSKDEIRNFISRAMILKERHKKGIPDRSLIGRAVGLIFEKPSTRTRVSFEAACAHLGATPLFISTKDTQLSRSEPVCDTARVLSRYLDALVIRSYSQDLIEDFAKFSDIPVINALSDSFHPCQVMSDIMTVEEKKGDISGLKVAWVGDGNNMAQSWINAAAVLGFELVLACPTGYEPDSSILDATRKKSGGRIRLTRDPAEAVAGADVINTDVWASMGKEDEAEDRKKVFMPYQVNAGLLESAAKGAIVLHCLPAHRGEEITADVLEGPNSVVWDQSENKLHMHKAVLDILVS